MQYVKENIISSLALIYADKFIELKKCPCISFNIRVCVSTEYALNKFYFILIFSPEKCKLISLSCETECRRRVIVSDRVTAERNAFKKRTRSGRKEGRKNKCDARIDRENWVAASD